MATTNIKVNIESSLKLSTIEFIIEFVVCLLDKLILLSICMVWLGLVWFGLYCSIFTLTVRNAPSPVCAVCECWYVHDCSTPKFGRK